MNKRVSILVLVLLAGCRQSVPQQSAQPANSTRPQPPAPLPPKVRPTIDPKSDEAANELVAGFVRALNAGKFGEAYMLLGPGAGSRQDFDKRLTGIKNLRVETGKAGKQEGAAGSIYVSVPLTISGEASGEHARRNAGVILRRVNDVSGSTEAQRRWHIERMNWGDD